MHPTLHISTAVEYSCKFNKILRLKLFQLVRKNRTNVTPAVEKNLKMNFDDFDDPTPWDGANAPQTSSNMPEHTGRKVAISTQRVGTPSPHRRPPLMGPHQ